MPTVRRAKDHNDGLAFHETHIRLTDRHLRAFSHLACSREVRDTVERGLIAQVLPSGLVRFTVRYRARDAQTGRLTQRRLKLGEYPALSLQKARTVDTPSGSARIRAQRLPVQTVLVE